MSSTLRVYCLPQPRHPSNAILFHPTPSHPTKLNSIPPHPRSSQVPSSVYPMPCILSNTIPTRSTACCPSRSIYPSTATTNKNTLDSGGWYAIKRNPSSSFLRGTFLRVPTNDNDFPSFCVRVPYRYTTRTAWCCPRHATAGVYAMYILYPALRYTDKSIDRALDTGLETTHTPQ